MVDHSKTEQMAAILSKTIPKPNKWQPFCHKPFENWTNGGHFVKNHSKTEPFENQTTIDHPNSEHVRNSSPHCSQLEVAWWMA